MIALVAAGVLAVPPAVVRLEADLKRNDSATAVLQARCDRVAPAGTRIRARPVASVDDPAAEAVARRDLHVGWREPMRHRRVELTCGEAVFSRADNWYLPGRLTPQMNTALDTTQTPFGVVVTPLRFQRRTLSTVVLPGPNVLQNRATLSTPDGRPFSLVVETYTDQALAP